MSDKIKKRPAKEQKAYFPDPRKGHVVPIRSAAAKQSKTISIQCIPSSTGISQLCAQICLYGLTVGFPKNDVASAYVSLQVLLIDAMNSGPVRLEKAPAFWWMITNAVRPKTIHGRVVHSKNGRRNQITPSIAYGWNTEKLSPLNQPVFDGYCLGAIDTNSNVSGFWGVDTSAIVIPGILLAAELAATLFDKLANDHPLQKHMDIFLNDASVFSFKIPWYQQLNPNDNGLTAFSIVCNEVPIRVPWLAFLNLVELKSVPTESRIPKYQRSGQGGAQHLGVRLDFPKFLGARYHDMSLDFRPVPVGEMIKRSTVAWQQANSILGDGGRPSMLPVSGTSLVPPYFYNGAQGSPPINDSNNPGVNKGLFILDQMVSNCALFLSRAASWTGLSQSFQAITAGTNNINQTITEGLVSELFTVANQRELGVNYIRPLNKLVVCFPTINENFGDEYFAQFPNCFDDTTNPTYGGKDMDYLNSNISGNTVAWTEGKGVAEDLKNVSRIFTIYSGVIPTAPTDAVIASPNTNAAINLEIVEPSVTKRALVLANIIKQRRLPASTVAKFEDILTVCNENRLKKLAGTRTSTRSSTLTSPSMLTFIIRGNGSSFEVESTRGIEDLLIEPVAYYDAMTNTNAAKIISDLTSTYEPGYDTATSYDNKASDTGYDLAKDFTNDQQSQILSDLQALTSNEVVESQANWEDILDTVTDFLPPRFRVLGKVAKALVPVGKKIASNVRARRAKKMTAAKK